MTRKLFFLISFVLLVQGLMLVSGCTTIPGGGEGGGGWSGGGGAAQNLSVPDMIQINEYALPSHSGGNFVTWATVATNDGSVWLVEMGPSMIAKFMNGAFSEYRVDYYPNEIKWNPVTGMLNFVECGSAGCQGKYGILNPSSGSKQECATGYGVGSAYYVAVDQSGTFWFSGYGGPTFTNHLASVVNSSISVSITLPYGSYYSGLAIDSSGNKWMACHDASSDGLSTNARLCKVTSGGDISFIALPTNALNLTSPLAVNGKIWFIGWDCNSRNTIWSFDPGSSQFTTYQVPTANCGIISLADDSLGRIWFTESRSNKIGVLDPQTAQITEYAVPTASSWPYGITVDKIRNIVWFTEQASGKIGKISLIDSQQTIDNSVLDGVERKAFDYFWSSAHPVSGMAYDKIDVSGEASAECVSGGTGMGMMVIIAGIERGYITRTEGAQRIQKILEFLDMKAEKTNGAWVHFMDGTTGANMGNEGADIVETSLVAQGLITVNRYFNKNNDIEEEIRGLANMLWKSIEWRAFYDSSDKRLYWCYKNGTLSSDSKFWGFTEGMITYLLGIASPNLNANLPVDCYANGWARTGDYTTSLTYAGIPQYVQAYCNGMDISLYWTQYSYLGLDPRAINDGTIPSDKTYYDVFRNITLINREYCINNPGGYAGYGPNVWGLTASEEPDSFGNNGYLAHSPTNTKDNGTIAPTAALSAMPYTPQESYAAMITISNSFPNSWGTYGYKDAFNPSQSWYSTKFLAIDVAPIALMIENFRSQLLWKLFMSHPDVQALLTNLRSASGRSWKIVDQSYPNPIQADTVNNWNYLWPMDSVSELNNWVGEGTGCAWSFDSITNIQGAGSFRIDPNINAAEAKIKTSLDSKLSSWNNANYARINVYVPKGCNMNSLMLYVFRSDPWSWSSLVHTGIKPGWNQLNFEIAPDMKINSSGLYLGFSCYSNDYVHSNYFVRSSINMPVYVDGIAISSSAYTPGNDVSFVSEIWNMDSLSQVSSDGGVSNLRIDAENKQEGSGSLVVAPYGNSSEAKIKMSFTSDQAKSWNNSRYISFRVFIADVNNPGINGLLFAYYNNGNWQWEPYRGIWNPNVNLQPGWNTIVYPLNKSYTISAGSSQFMICFKNFNGNLGTTAFQVDDVSVQ